VRYKTTVGGRELTIEINRDDEVIVDGRPVPVDFRWLEGNTTLSLLIDHNSYEALVDERGDGYDVLLYGRLFNVGVEDERVQRLKHDSRGFPPPSGEFALRAPIPGQVVMVPVKVGQAVREGDVLVVLESMKMENELKAPRDGQVVSLRVQDRQSVESNQILLVLS
jgi:biotin carboxyl carrier protein